jgi:hypothetical protein
MRTAAAVAASSALVVAAVVSTAVVSTALVSAAVARAEAPAHQLEGRRIRAGAVYVGTVSAVRRLGSLDGLSGDTQGRMEATVQVAKPLRGPAGAPAEVGLRFDTRAPEAEGEGYYTLAPGEAVLVFTDQVAEPAYPRELLHGAPEALAAEVKGLRDALLALDADLLRLNGVTPSARAAQVRLYDQALAALSRLTAAR